MRCLGRGTMLGRSRSEKRGTIGQFASKYIRFCSAYANDKSRVFFNRFFSFKEAGEDGAKQYIWLESPTVDSAKACRDRVQ